MHASTPLIAAPTRTIRRLGAALMLALGLAACDDPDAMAEETGAPSGDESGDESGDDSGDESGDDSGGSGADDSDTSDGGGATSETEAILRGYNAPRVAESVGEDGLFVVISAVYEASLQGSGGAALITTGTLAEGANGSFTYAPAPADRLVVDWQSGADTEIVVETLEGDFEAESAEAFLAASHQIFIHYARAGEADVTVQSDHNGTNRSALLDGTIEFDGLSYEVDVRFSGDTVFEHGSMSTRYERNSEMSGTIVGPGFHLEAQEEFWEVAFFTDVHLTNKIREASSWFEVDGTTYVLDGLYIREATTNGRPENSDDYWRAEGTISVDGVTTGEISMVENPAGIDIVLDTAEGRTVLESHL